MNTQPTSTLHRITRTLAILSLALTSGAWAQSVSCSSELKASYTQPTTRYAHGVLGDNIEYGALKIEIANPADQCTDETETQEAVLPESMVFEDLQPRLIDLDGDQHPEIITVESSDTEGARLAIWGVKSGELQRLAATPYIGRAFRWLAPIGAADFDADGHMEIAYIDRPHLAQTLRIWRYQNGSLPRSHNAQD